MSERDPLVDDKRPDVFDLWKIHHFDVKAVCKRSQLKRALLLTMLRNQPIGRKEAEKVLFALSNYLGQTYTTHTVRVQVIEEKETRP